MTNQPAPDPTHGRIDRDIQAAVDEMNPTTLGQRVAIENTLQERRDGGAALEWSRAQVGKPYAGAIGPAVVDTRMSAPGAPDWGGELTPEGAHLYHHAWPSVDGELNLWVGPYAAELSDGWAVTISSPAADIVMRCTPDQVIGWATSVIAAVTNSRSEAGDTAAPTEPGTLATGWFRGNPEQAEATTPPGATTRARIVDDLRMLAEARGQYCHSCPESEADLRAMSYLELAVHTEHETADRLADVIEGTNNAKGWLPSWRWAEWEARQ